MWINSGCCVFTGGGDKPGLGNVVRERMKMHLKFEWVEYSQNLQATSWCRQTFFGCAWISSTTPDCNVTEKSRNFQNHDSVTLKAPLIGVEYNLGENGNLRWPWVWKKSSLSTSENIYRPVFPSWSIQGRCIEPKTAQLSKVNLRNFAWTLKIWSLDKYWEQVGQ